MNKEIPTELVEEKINELEEAGIKVLDIVWVKKQPTKKTRREKFLERLRNEM